MRIIRTILAAVFCMAAAAPPPAVLRAYIHDGRFEPGDYGWLKARFDDASPAEKAAYAQVERWLEACVDADRAGTLAELRGMGFADPKLERGGVRDPLCAAVASAARPGDLGSFARFAQTVAAARPIADTFLAAVRTADEAAGPRGPTLADELLARPVAEQMLRFGLGWGEGPLKRAPALAPEVKAVVTATLAAELAQRDRANARWLREIVEKRGWPRISEVGGPASAQAWLLVQHADADPAFQLRALRLMEPLVAAGEVSKRDHAYLYDRVMLRLSGKQRYATQVMCEKGRRVPLPLEDGKAMPKLRAEAELKPFAEYLIQMREVAGDCPAG